LCYALADAATAVITAVAAAVRAHNSQVLSCERTTRPVEVLLHEIRGAAVAVAIDAAAANAVRQRQYEVYQRQIFDCGTRDTVATISATGLYNVSVGGDGGDGGVGDGATLLSADITSLGQPQLQQPAWEPLQQQQPQQPPLLQPQDLLGGPDEDKWLGQCRGRDSGVAVKILCMSGHLGELFAVADALQFELDLVIHLVRDPRAVLASRWRRAYVISAHCDRLLLHRMSSVAIRA
jgi:hypothetical protein